MVRDTREAEQGRGTSEWNVPKRPLGASGITAVERRKGEDLGSPLLFRWRNRVDLRLSSAHQLEAIPSL